MRRLLGVTLVMVAIAACTSSSHISRKPSPGSPTSAGPTTSNEPVLKSTPNFAYLRGDALVTVRRGVSAAFPVPTATEIQNGVVASPDGSRLAALDGKHLRVASSDRPSAYKTIASSTGRSMIVQFVWGDASKRLVYLVDSDIHSDRAVLLLYVVNRDGDGRTLIRRFTTPRNIVLERFSEHKGRVLWFETGEGGYFLNLSSVNVSNGAVRALAPNLEPLLRYSFAISPDLVTLYYVSFQSEGRAIKSRNTQTGITRLLYTAPHGESIHRLLISPSGKTLLFAEGTNLADTRESTWTMKSIGGEPTRILDGSSHPNAVPLSWSPGGRYVWLDFHCSGCGHEGEYYLLDLWSRTVTLAYFKSENDSITFVGWID